ncbi:MAG: discoidin domain-containing protein, partial [Flavisolibacter sp.]
MNSLLRSSVFFFLFQTICSSTYSQVNIATQHYNNDRTGWNNKETILNKSNVKPGSFGKLFAYPVDDQVYAQPLIIQNVNIPSVGIKNILYIATVNNSVYAFDADSFQIQPYWKKNFTPTNSRTVTAADVQGGWCTVYNNITNNIGIIGTPVIDTTTNTIYFVTRSYELASRVYNQYLHAIDITTGNERSNSPVIIAAQINGNGDGSINGIVSFDARKNNQRPGLLLLNGVVYIGFSSHCDFGPYHGWLLGYDATTLQQKYVYNNTPDGSNGGIWMSGTGPAADAAGNIYIATGNGTVGSGSDPSNIRNRGESLLKLNPSGSNLSVQDFFTPNNYQYLESNDLDFGTSGTMIIPNTNRILAGCKDGNIYLLDQNNLGGYNATTNQSAQAVNLGGGANMHAQFSYYGGAANEYAYLWPENTLLTAIPFLRTTGLFDNTKIVTSSIPSPNGQTGAMLSVSSNGSLDSTSILWASVPSNCDAESNTCPGILRAIDAMDVTKEMWNSGTLSSDNAGSFAKFNSPVVANGKVYLGTFSNQVVVYGLLNSGTDTCQSSNLAFHKNAIASSFDNQQSGPGGAFDNDITTHWTSQTGDYAYLNVDLGKRYNICRIL